MGKTDAEGYTYDPLDRLISTTTPDGKTENIEYNGEGQVVSTTDKGGHTTKHVLDGNGRVVETIDALGNVTTYQYDGSKNLVSKTDADHYTTKYTCNGLDMVTHINYNGGKQVDYAYNSVGDLVRMEDWTGINTFEYDLLSQLKKVTDHKGNVVKYDYDGNGNQTVMTYPDGSKVNYTYDGKGNMTSVTESDGRTTRYQYDGMGRVTRMEYPHGWVEEYSYDAIGQLLSVTDTDPSGKDMKEQKHAYRYDSCGNMTYEYMRGNGTGESTVENDYSYDALHRVVRAEEHYGHEVREYTYDSLGNLTYERNSNNYYVDYILNDLNQITESSTDGWKTQTNYTYDGRGNLVEKTYGKNKKVTTTAEYVFDETNKMVLGYNALRESSEYTYNGLGALVTNTWVIAKNGYGYHDVDALVNGEELLDPDDLVPDLEPEVPETPDEAEKPDVEPETPDVDEKPDVDPETPDVTEKPDVEPETPDVTEKPDVEPETPDVAERPDVEPETPDVAERPDVEPETPEVAGEPEALSVASNVVDDPETSDVNNEGKGNNNGNPGKGHGNGNGNNGNGNKPDPEPTDPVDPDVTDPVDPETPDEGKPDNNGNGNSSGNNGQGNGNAAGNGDGNGNINKTSTVVKQFVVDYNTETFEPLMEHEVNGLDYKYVYGNDRLSVDISPIDNSGKLVENGNHIRLYYHMDYLGTTDYLTSPVSGKVEAWTHYNEWGLITHNAVLKCGQRELDLVKRYATHDYDSVLELYYAKARFYDAHDRRFTAVDPILDPSGYDLREYVENPVQLVQHLYALDNPLNYFDPNGEVAVAAVPALPALKTLLTVLASGVAAYGAQAFVNFDSWLNSRESSIILNDAEWVSINGELYVPAFYGGHPSWALTLCRELTFSITSIIVQSKLAPTVITEELGKGVTKGVVQSLTIKVGEATTSYMDKVGCDGKNESDSNPKNGKPNSESNSNGKQPSPSNSSGPNKNGGGNGSSLQPNQKPEVKNDIPKQLKISEGQLGKKWGEHMRQYPELDSYVEYRQLAQDIFQNPEKVFLNSEIGEYFFVRGKDLLRVKLDGTFVSLYPGVNSALVQKAIQIR